jgi:two-component system, cell cycle response regulator CtrA
MCEPGARAGLIAAMLRRGGHSVTAAESAADLVHLAKVLDHDVVLFDPSLPDMTGVALIRALRHGGVMGPVCLLSADSDAEMRIRALEMGADDFIRSPINGKEQLWRGARRGMPHRWRGLAI